MAISRQQLFKNTSILMISQVISWGLSLVLTLYLPRYLGVENIGKYQLAISLWSIVVILATFGMDTYLTREIAQDHSRVNLLLSQSIVIKLSLFIIGSALLAVYLTFTHYAASTIQVIAILGITYLLNLFSAGFAATIQGLERVEYLGMITVLTNIISTSINLIAIFLGASLITIAWISCVSVTCSLTLYLLILSRINQFRFTFSFTGLRPFLLTSLSFFLLQVFINLYQQVDVIVISWIVNEKGVGWYGVATRLTGSLMFIPTVFMTVFFPTFSRLQAQSPEELDRLFRKAFNLMLLLAVAVGAGMFIIAGPLVQLIYGAEFANSGPILALRGLVSIPTFLNIILGIYLMATNRQKPWIWVMAIATVATIPLDLVLVPYCERVLGNGAMGGAWSFTLTEVGMAIAGICLLPKNTLRASSLWYAARAFLAGALMVLGVWWIKDYFIAVPIIAGGIIFLVLIILFRLVSKEEWQLLRGFVFSVINRFQKRAVRQGYEA